MRWFRDDPPQGVNWLLDATEMAIEHIGSDYLVDGDLVLPTDEFYPVALGAPDAVERVFALTVEYAGLEDWPLKLAREAPFSGIRAFKTVVGSRLSGAVASGLLVDESTSPPTLIVTYVDDDLAAPDGFIYHVASQLADALSFECETIPGGDEWYWQFVDVVVCLMGFGVIASNASFIYQGFSEGTTEGYWHQRRGALTTEQFATVLAIFTLCKGIPSNRATTHLRPNPRAAFNKAIKHLKQKHSERISALNTRAALGSGALSFPLAESGAISSISKPDGLS